MAASLFLSVVIPTYNRREMLRECLETLEAQTYPRDLFEVIVVNDGSQDGTDSFLEAYQKKAGYLLRYYNQENRGVSAARNLGIANAAGDVVVFIDDDCMAEKGLLQMLSGGYTDDSIGCVGGAIVSYPPATYIEKYIDKKNLLTQENFLSCGPVITSNTSYRRSILLDVKGFDPDIKTCEDGELGIRVRLRGYRMIYIKEARVLHKHRSSAKALLKQQYDYAIGNARMHKKYLKDFNAGYNLTMIALKTLQAIATYPLTIIKALRSGDATYCLAEPVIDVAVLSMHAAGLIRETFFGKPYTGEKYPEKVPFLPDQSAEAIWRKMLKKAGPGV